MNGLYEVYEIIQWVCAAALGLSTLLLFSFALGGFFYRQAPYPESPKFRKIAILIPAFAEDNVICEVATQALLQEYPTYLYDVIIIADSLRKRTLNHLKTLPVTVIEVNFEPRTKAKALNRAMELLPNDYQIALVLDADNLMATDFLYKVNASFDMGNMAVQGHRKAKNLDTPFAILDGISEEINNHIFRKGHCAMGLSACIIGSGMAFDYDWFKTEMIGNEAIGGFDKELEMILHRKGVAIEYLDDAILYDEKVRNSDAFLNQRKRWVHAQYHYLRTDLRKAWKEFIAHGNFGYLHKVMLFSQPPRLILLGILFLLGSLFLTLNMVLGVKGLLNMAWISIAACSVLTYLFSIPLSFYSLRTFKALLVLPEAFILMLKTYKHITKAQKTFLHTRHGIDDIAVDSRKNCA